MKGRIFYLYLITLVCFAGLSVNSLAQTITGVTFPAAPVCPGSNVTVSYAISGTFAAGNVFTAYLSDAAGSSYTTVIGTVSSRTAGTIPTTLPTGAVDGSGYRIRVIASSPAVNGTSGATLTISSPVKPGITTPLTYCEGDVAPALTATPSAGGTLKWYGTSATSGSSSSTSTPPDTKKLGNTIYYVSQVVGGCESARAEITVTVNAKPAQPGVTAISYCVGQQASSLTATPASGATLKWYGTDATGGTVTPTPVPSTSTSGNTTYYVSQTVNGCESSRIGLTVTVNTIPAAPTVPTSLTYCEGITAPALTATGQNLKWYGINATGGTGSSNASIPGTTVIGTTNYYVSQTVNNCESSRATIPVVVRASPAAPATTAPPAYCQSQTASALAATPTAGGTLNWYGTFATGGSPSPTASIPNTAQAGTVSYYVSQSVNGCEGPRASIAVTVKSTPSAPTISSPIIACQNQSGQTLTATPSTGGSLNWYGTLATGGTPSATAPVLSTSALGSTSYYVSQSVNGCEGPRVPITVTVNAVPAAPAASAPSPYCAGTSAQSLTATSSANGTLKWYGTNATGGTGSSNASIPNTTAAGTTNYYVSQTVSGCESDRTSIAVQVKETPGLPSLPQQDLSFCQYYDAVTLNATASNGAKLNWWGENSSGGTRSDTPPSVPNNVDKTYAYYVSQTLDGCESGLGSPSGRAVIKVRVKTTPGAPGVSPLDLCNNQQTQQLTANGSNLKWFDAANNLLNEAPKPTTNTVGSQTYKVSQTSAEGCESKDKATLTVTIKPLPGAPGVSNLTYCQKQEDQPSQNIGPLTADGQALKWYSTDGNSSSSAPTPSIDKVGTQTFSVSQTVNGCEGGRSTLLVTIVTPGLPTTPKPLVTYCINDQAVPLVASGDAGSQLRWVDPYGRVTTNAPTPSTLNTNVQSQGDPFYVYQIASNGCYSARAVIRVVVNTTPTLSIAASTTNVNLGVRVPLQLRFTGAGPYSYSLTEGYTGISRSDTTIMVLPRGNTTYRVAAVTNGCGAGLPGNSVNISVRVPTVSTSSFGTTTLCAGTSLSVPFTTTGEFNQGNAFRIEVANAADTTKKFTFQTTANSSPVTSPIPITLASGQYYVRVKADNPEVGITGSNSPTLLTVRSLPTATLTGTQNIYEGTPASLTLTFGGDGPWNAIYADSIRTYTVSATTSPLVVEARPARTTAYRLTSVTNSCGSGPISGTATISVLPLLGVDDNSLDPLVKAYPVPTATTLMVELNLPLTREPATLSITDQRGRPVLQHTTRAQMNELDLTAQPSGLYILRIQVGDRQTARKVLKQ